MRCFSTDSFRALVCRIQLQNGCHGFFFRAFLRIPQLGWETVGTTRDHSVPLISRKIVIVFDKKAQHFNRASSQVLRWKL